jgi:hypothetical protein
MADRSHDEQIDAAIRKGAQMSPEVLASSVRYDPERRIVTVALRSGASFSFPVDKIQGLTGASDSDLSEVEIDGDGYGLHWERLDVDYSVGGLAAGIFGTARYIAQQAGRSRSDAKAAAARANGAKGGRPRRTARG